MSGATQCMEYRKPTTAELRLLKTLVQKTSNLIPPSWEENLLVKPMKDGGMGSLYLYPEGAIKEDRIFGKQVSEFQFTDEDGVEVIASLNLDNNGDLFELDLWKTNFDVLVRLPG